MVESLLNMDFPNIAEHVEILSEHGKGLSVSQILLIMEKSSLNMQAYQFPRILLNMGKSLLDMEAYHFFKYS